MSRIGKLPIAIPTGVTVTCADGVVSVKGAKGTLSQEITGGVEVAIEEGATLVRVGTALFGPRHEKTR